MRSIPGTLQGGGAPFLTTEWSVVWRSLESQTLPSAQSALTQLCQAYWPPLYSFVRRRGYNSADAQDLVQEFFAYLLERRAYAGVDPAKGKFRSFLLVSLKHFLADARDRERALKRGGGQPLVPLDEQLVQNEATAFADPAGGAAHTDEERLFEQRWATALVGRALARLRASLVAEGKTRFFEELTPYVTGGASLPNQEETAARLGLPAATLRTHIHRLRGRYREVLRAEVAATIASSRTAEIDEELRHLCRVLMSG